MLSAPERSVFNCLIIKFPKYFPPNAIQMLLNCHPVLKVVLKRVHKELRLIPRILDNLARGAPRQELDQAALHHQPE